MARVKIYLPYYMVEPVNDDVLGKRFYGEAHLSLKTAWYRMLVLATPKQLPFEKVPFGGVKLDPLVGPREYGLRIEEALNRAQEIYASKPAFRIGGLRGLLRMMYDGLLGRKAKAGPELEARLILHYTVEVLGFEPGSKLRIYPETLWLPVEIGYSGRTITNAYIVSGGRREEFPLLVKFARLDPSVKTALLNAVNGWKPL